MVVMMYFFCYNTCTVYRVKNLNFLFQVPSVPSDLNCVSWSGEGTAILQVSIYKLHVHIAEYIILGWDL